MWPAEWIVDKTLKPPEPTNSADYSVARCERRVPAPPALTPWRATCSLRSLDGRISSARSFWRRTLIAPLARRRSRRPGRSGHSPARSARSSPHPRPGRSGHSLVAASPRALASRSRAVPLARSERPAGIPARNERRFSRRRRRRARRRRGRGWRGASQVDGVVVGGGPLRGLLGAAGEADAVGADLGMTQVQADAPGEAAPLRPRVGEAGAAGRAGHRRDDASVHAESRVELADVVQQRGREPARSRRRTACPRAAPPLRARRGSCGGGRGAGWSCHCAYAAGVSTDSTHATSSGARRDRARARARSAPTGGAASPEDEPSRAGPRRDRGCAPRSRW